MIQTAKNKAAFITGVTGQVGSYLAEYLLARDYTLYGMARRSSTPNTKNLQNLLGKTGFTLLEGDLTDPLSIRQIVSDIASVHKSFEIYNLGAQSHVHTSFQQPIYTFKTILDGTTYLLEEMRRLQKTHSIKMYQASTSEMYGNVPCPITGYTETTGFAPESPYAVAKLAAHQMCINYRYGYGLNVSCGIMFNNESPRRGDNFVTQKICKYVKAVRERKTNEKLVLGNLDSFRDWGSSLDYLRAAHMMLEQNVPDDYVIATGKTHSIRHLLKTAFYYIGCDYKDYVISSAQFKRPNEVNFLLGDSTKIRQRTGWTPYYDFATIIKEMIDAA